MKRLAFPIGFKIFGVASSMLSILLTVAYLNHRNIALVNHELIDLANYSTKLTEDVAKINIHSLEQEIHYERAIRLLETEPVDQALVAQELQQFADRNAQVDAELERAIARVAEATEKAKAIEDAIEFARIHPLLEILETEHQNFHDQSLAVVEAFQTGKTTEAEILDRQLERFEADFDAHIQAVLFELGDFAEATARSAAIHERQALRLSWALAVVATGVGLSFASLVTLGLVRPIRKLVQSTQAIEQGDFQAVPMVSQDEVGRLSVAFNTMMTDIQAKADLKATFGQYVDPRVVDRLISESGAVLPPQRQEMTVFFSDMAGFSTISELLTPTGLVTLINQYLTLAAEPILAHDGMIDQFIGDAVTAFWGPPFVAETDHAKLACRSALEQLTQLVKLRRMLPEIMGIRKGLPEIRIRIGLATGELVAGSLGSEQSKSYTVLGAPMQVAEYLEGANKRYGTTILLTEATQQAAAEAIATRPIDRLILPGQSTPSTIYELLDTPGSLTAQQEELRSHFSAGLMAYWSQDWSVAQSHFVACGAIAPHDQATQLYLERLQILRQYSPGANWDGVWRGGDRN